MWWSSKSNMNTKLIGLMHITYYQLRCLAAIFIPPLLPPIQADGKFDSSTLYVQKTLIRGVLSFQKTPDIPICLFV